MPEVLADLGDESVGAASSRLEHDERADVLPAALEISDADDAGIRDGPVPEERLSISNGANRRPPLIDRRRSRGRGAVGSRPRLAAATSPVMYHVTAEDALVSSGAFQ